MPLALKGAGARRAVLKGASSDDQWAFSNPVVAFGAVVVDNYGRPIVLAKKASAMSIAAWWVGS